MVDIGELKDINFLSNKERQKIQEMLDFERRKLEQDIIVREKIDNLKIQQEKLEEQENISKNILNLFSNKKPNTLDN